MKWGCDVNCGNTYLHMLQAYEEGLVTEEQITTACERLFTTRMRLGMFNEHTEYDDIPYEVNDCAEHAAANLKTAEKSMVLLKNNGVLPLDKKQDQKPLRSSARMLTTRRCSRALTPGTASRCVTLALRAFSRQVNPDTRVYYSQGCHLFKTVWRSSVSRTTVSRRPLPLLERSDVVILCLGLDATIEGEQGDAGNATLQATKVTLDLPGAGRAHQGHHQALGKPTILLQAPSVPPCPLTMPMSIATPLLRPWYPGALGGVAAANILFGEASPSGKLPVTFYKGA